MSVEVQFVEGQRRTLPAESLGRFGPGRYKDEGHLPIPDRGFEFIVTQASYGATGITARALEGYTVEALSLNEIDPETGRARWQTPSDFDQQVLVAHDRGRLHLMSPSASWVGVKMGREGLRTGLIRVTNTTTGEIRHFMLSAEFRGQEDSWFVTRYMDEVAITESDN